MNTTMPRMTVTGERIVSPITDPINRVVALINGCESDGTDAQDNQPRETRECVMFGCAEQTDFRNNTFCTTHFEENLELMKVHALVNGIAPLTERVSAALAYGRKCESLAVIAQREAQVKATCANVKRGEWVEELDLVRQVIA